MSNPSPNQVLHAYRHLYRGVLHAIQFSKPGRYIVRNQLRTAFRREDVANFNQEKIERTIEFLRLAAQETGLEHKLLKNLVHMEYLRSRQYMDRGRKDRTSIQMQMRKSSRVPYDMTLSMLNETMGLCLR